MEYLKGKMFLRDYDREIGLYYLRAKYYSADLGRFISRDPIWIADDLNLYAYVGNGPVMYTDPTGEVKNAIIWGIYVWWQFLLDATLWIETAVSFEEWQEIKEYDFADEVWLDEETLKNAWYVGTVVWVSYWGYKIYKNVKKGRVDKIIDEKAIKDNINRFIKKLPSNAKDTFEKISLENWNILLRWTSAWKVPWSKAVYEKIINSLWETLSVNKTTYWPDWKVIHIKDKIGWWIQYWE